MRQPRPQSYLRHPLNELLATPAAVRVLRELCLKGAAVATAQLARETLLTLTAVRRTLAQLSATGIVESFGPRAGVYSLNQSHPLATVLQQLFQSERTWWEAVFTRLAEAAAPDARIVAAYLYGSVARKEDRPGSDVDVLLVTHSDPEPAVEAYRGWLQDLERQAFINLSVVGLSVEEVRQRVGAADELWTNLIKDGLPIKGGRPEYLAGTHDKARAKKRSRR